MTDNRVESTGLPTLAEFYDLLAEHDWTYNYSDDGNMWRRGLKQYKLIDSIIALGGEEYENLYHKWFGYMWNKAPRPERPA